MKEIGGYFELEELTGKEYYPDLIHLNLGRTALLFILEALHTNKLAVPYFLCDSVIETCKEAGVSLRYYNITENFLPDPSFQIEADEYLYLVNYYGQLSDETVLQMREQYDRIIADYTHSFFQPPCKTVPTLYSCRKYFGLPDGAYVYLPDTPTDLPLIQDVSSERMRHILGRYEHSASDYYKDMLSTAHSFNHAPLLRMSRLTQNLLKAIPYDQVIEKRTANSNLLHQHLAHKNLLQISVPKGAFCYPFLCNEGPALKKALAQRKIFVPTYWSNVIDSMPQLSIEHHYAKNILPLPCDQRYSAEDMKYMLDILEEEIKKLENQDDK